jgi:hypothetical protein
MLVDCLKELTILLELPIAVVCSGHREEIGLLVIFGEKWLQQLLTQWADLARFQPA